MVNYQTEQRKYLLDFFEKNRDRQFSIDVIQNEVTAVSRSAIYRNINQMVDDGFIRRFQKEGCRKFYYQYVGNSECRAHLHLKCSACGTIFHMDLDTSNKLLEFLEHKIEFSLDINKTMLLGCCRACR